MANRLTKSSLSSIILDAIIVSTNNRSLRTPGASIRQAYSEMEERPSKNIFIFKNSMKLNFFCRVRTCQNVLVAESARLFDELHRKTLKFRRGLPWTDSERMVNIQNFDLKQNLNPDELSGSARLDFFPALMSS